MNYLQHISQAMLKMGDSDMSGAEAEFQVALAEARKVDPDGPREAEVLNYLALFYGQQGRQADADAASAKAGMIFKKFEDL